MILASFDSASAIQSITQGVASEAKLLETAAYGEIEYRRYELASAELPVGNGTVSVFRTSKAWQQPALIKKTVYFFHAGNSDDRQLIATGGPQALAALGTKGSLDEIQIVCPAFANSFLSAPFENWYWNQVRPWAEQGTQTQSATRFTAGTSMGGFVSLSLFFAHTDFFAGAAANAPALLNWDFYDAAQAKNYSERTKIPLGTAEYLKGFFSAAFASRSAYDLRDPIRLAKAMASNQLAGKSIYLDVGALDDLGLQEGTSQLQTEAARLTRQDHFEMVQGGHHDAAFFTQQLQKTLEFLLQ